MTATLSTTSTEPVPASRAGVRRILAIARIHVVAWPILIAAPLAILALTFAINFAIFALIDSSGETHATGSILALYGFVVAFYAQAMTQTYPFALGLGVTRRQFFVATVAVALAQSFGFAVLFQSLSAIEAATDGWGVHMRMFGILRYVTDSTLLQFATSFASLLLTTAISIAFGAVYQRWKTVGFLIAGVSVVCLLGLAAVLVTWADRWPTVGSWLVDAPRALVLAALPVGVSAATLGASWAIVRRATT
ncbi:ABC transporter permease [Prescottella agglutinans]|uniref:ABC transporter permease n=1 Tax=Prescottella agglutinans TaxID=1644129 RepID=UPI003D972385